MKEVCPKCNLEKLGHRVGSDKVFYTCVGCGYKYEEDIRVILK